VLMLPAFGNGECGLRALRADASATRAEWWCPSRDECEPPETGEGGSEATGRRACGALACP
jgi:hypothetical protein